MPQHGRQIVSISVPSDLRQRMKGAKGMNWSAIACRAFEAELLRADRKGTGLQRQVMQRLRSSTMKHEVSSFQSGFQAGYDWARKKAATTELQMLEQLAEAHRGEEAYRWRTFLENCGAGAGKQLKDLVQINTRLDDSKFANGFVDGAMDVWKSVRHEL